MALRAASRLARAMSPQKITKVSAKNDPKLSKNCSEKASRTSCAKKTTIFRSPTRLGIDFGCLGALQGAPGRSLWAPGATLGAPGARRRRPKTLPRRPEIAPGNALGRHRPSGEAPAIDFRSICDAPKLLPGRLLDRLGLPRLICLDVGCRGRSTCHRSGLLEFAWLSSTKPSD